MYRIGTKMTRSVKWTRKPGMHWILLEMPDDPTYKGAGGLGFGEWIVVCWHMYRANNEFVLIQYTLLSIFFVLLLFLFSDQPFVELFSMFLLPLLGLCWGGFLFGYDFSECWKLMRGAAWLKYMQSIFYKILKK